MRGLRAGERAERGPRTSYDVGGTLHGFPRTPSAGLPFFVVDAFADRPFTGNPAGVVLLDAPAPEAWMQKVAREVNHAETSFVHPVAGGFALRWFTPTKEVDLCGHATLAAAHVLFEEKRLPPLGTARFETKSGTLKVARSGDLLVLDFPTHVPVAEPAPAGLVDALGQKVVETLQTPHDWMCVLEDEAAVRACVPDLRALAALGSRGVIVTAKASVSAADFVVRYFAPAYGIPEDPATGSIQCALGPYWRKVLGKPSTDPSDPSGRRSAPSHLVARQLSERGATLRVKPGPSRTEIAGEAFTTVRGRLEFPP